MFKNTMKLHQLTGRFQEDAGLYHENRVGCSLILVLDEVNIE